jgi:hypothetical protein
MARFYTWEGNPDGDGRFLWFWVEYEGKDEAKCSWFHDNHKVLLFAHKKYKFDKIC